jgi:hypothetical protein
VREITHFAMLMVNHDVMRFYVSMHDAFWMAVVQGLGNL